MPAPKEIKTWFSQKVDEHMDSLYSLALRLTRNATDAEDLVADAVTKAWSAIHTLDDHNRLHSWMFRILHNCFISDYRKKSKRPVMGSYDESYDNNDDQLASLLIRQPDDFLHWWANPEQAFSNELLGEDILSAIDCLPEAFRVTVLLVNVEGLSYDEAAGILDVPPGTVRSRMKRGRTLLQKALWQHAKDAGLLNSNTLREHTV